MWQICYLDPSFVMQEKMTADEAATSPSQSAVARCKQVEYLQQQMHDLNLEQQLQGAKVNLADPHGTLQKYFARICLLLCSTDSTSMSFLFFAYLCVQLRFLCKKMWQICTFTAINYYFGSL